MTKQFLVTVDYGNVGQPARDDEFLRAEVQGYAEALFEFYGLGNKPAVKVMLPCVSVDRQGQVIYTDNERR